MVAKKLFSFSKTKLGGLIVGLSFGKFSRLLPIKGIIETDKVIAFWHPKPLTKNTFSLFPKNRSRIWPHLKKKIWNTSTVYFWWQKI